MTGQTVDRCNFKLVTRGYGPIGAPTMTLDDVYGVIWSSIGWFCRSSLIARTEMEVAMGMIPQAGAQAPQVLTMSIIYLTVQTNALAAHC